MKAALVSDVHSNLEALQAVEKSLGELGVEKVCFIGDAVGYGPDSDACTEWIMQNAGMSVMGNHDLAAAGLTDVGSFNPNARAAILWTMRHMKDVSLEFLRALPMRQIQDGMTLVHANPMDPGGWNYIFSLWDAEMNFPFFEGPFCFVGHSHQPAAVGMDPKGAVSVQPLTAFPIQEGFRYLVNVGSVGQPRDGNPASCFGFLDTDRGQFSFIRVPYDYRKTQKKMEEAGLPRPLIERLAEGR
jgi:diadenosine tetraphosphatase ApaH/serine/threonine PP2A family protein phosphatase